MAETRWEDLTICCPQCGFVELRTGTVNRATELGGTITVAEWTRPYCFHRHLGRRLGRCRVCMTSYRWGDDSCLPPNHEDIDSADFVAAAAECVILGIDRERERRLVFGGEHPVVEAMAKALGVNPWLVSAKAKLSGLVHEDWTLTDAGLSLLDERPLGDRKLEPWRRPRREAYEAVMRCRAWERTVPVLALSEAVVYDADLRTLTIRLPAAVGPEFVSHAFGGVEAHGAEYVVRGG